MKFIVEDFASLYQEVATSFRDQVSFGILDVTKVKEIAAEFGIRKRKTPKVCLLFFQ